MLKKVEMLNIDPFKGFGIEGKFWQLEVQEDRPWTFLKLTEKAQRKGETKHKREGVSEGMRSRRNGENWSLVPTRKGQPVTWKGWAMTEVDKSQGGFQGYLTRYSL